MTTSLASYLLHKQTKTKHKKKKRKTHVKTQASNKLHWLAAVKEGLIHKWKQALLLAPPLPLILLNNSWLCSTHKHSSAFFSTAACYQQYIVRILVKAQSSTRSTGPRSPTGLAYYRKTWAYPTSTVSASVAFLPLLDTSLLSQGGITHYSQQLTL